MTDSDALAEPLGLRSVLVNSLPASLMTDEAPNRYPVEAVFTRRPQSDEVAEILSDSTRDYLARAGYPTVRVTVADRRLEIASTSLEELRDGLANVLADRLAEISSQVRTQHDATAVRLRDAATSERSRTAAVEVLAESITFLPSGERHHAAPDR